MLRKDYDNYKWYPVTDETYFVEDYTDEFPNCRTIIKDIDNCIYTMGDIYLSWSTMAKSNSYGEIQYWFMIIEL